MRTYTGVLDVPAGLPVSELDTPTLVIDLDAMERNVEQMAAFAAAHGVLWRPHAKMHKCAALARHLIEAGASGCCVQKVAEAQAMAAGGVTDIYISNEVLAHSKLKRLVALAAQLHASGGRLAVAADSVLAVEALAGHVRQHEQYQGPAPVDVLVEFNIGQNRAGVQTASEVLMLAQTVSDVPSLRFAGLHAYHGGAQHIESAVERHAVMQQAYAKVHEVVQVLRAHGLDVVTVTGAGTGTFALEAASGLYTELQPGSFLLMDAHYACVQPAAQQPVFEQALFVKTQVVSRATHHAVVDAGHKSHAIDSGLPMVWNGGAQVQYGFGNGGDEHGLITALAGAELPALGDVLWLVPGHCDPTINLHDAMVGLRGGLLHGVVERVFQVDARGALW
ncbi:DSD1 family PLP-dependent enzyme [Lampropedia puyangensis]|uniref:DSD1 family PLP-dependent enzyme n=1 Tax=Lampropedia puyangensis TaxID=1330072 RepID=A0A4S8FBD5_9BURK|nr:DSD1 family PLP-dependent enzyme [Lampropedia puyangensis]THU04587.1 DSD1 family PLP-dependent enzyme [Lampropedia puyangensis]